MKRGIKLALTLAGALVVLGSAASAQAAKLPNLKGKTIVAILPDSGERYLSSVLFEGIV